MGEGLVDDLKFVLVLELNAREFGRGAVITRLAYGLFLELHAAEGVVAIALISGEVLHKKTETISRYTMKGAGLGSYSIFFCSAS